MNKTMVMRIAAQYRKEGLNKSESLKKAWFVIKTIYANNQECHWYAAEQVLNLVVFKTVDQIFPVVNGGWCYDEFYTKEIKSLLDDLGYKYNYVTYVNPFSKKKNPPNDYIELVS